MTWHPRGACHDDACPSCATRAELRPEDFESDPFGWAADEAAEREGERGWRWAG